MMKGYLRSFFLISGVLTLADLSHRNDWNAGRLDLSFLVLPEGAHNAALWKHRLLLSLDYTLRARHPP